MAPTQAGAAPAGTDRRPREDEIDAHGVTHPGKVRRDNQDHYLLCSLRRQIVSYSKGHVAYQLTTWLRDGDRRAFVRLLYSLPKVYAVRAWQRVRRQSEYPLPLIATEILGCLAGPWALWRARRRVRRLGPSVRPHPHAVSMETQVAETSAS